MFQYASEARSHTVKHCGAVVNIGDRAPNLISLRQSFGSGYLDRIRIKLKKKNGSVIHLNTDCKYFKLFFNHLLIEKLSFYTSFRSEQGSRKKSSSTGGPNTKALNPNPSSLVVLELFLVLQKKFSFLSGPAFTPVPLSQ